MLLGSASMSGTAALKDRQLGNSHSATSIGAVCGRRKIGDLALAFLSSSNVVFFGRALSVCFPPRSSHIRSGHRPPKKGDNLEIAGDHRPWHREECQLGGE